MTDEGTPCPGSPLSPDEAKVLLLRFRRAFRPLSAKIDNVPTACVINGEAEPKIFETSDFLHHDRVHVYFEFDDDVRLATSEEVAAYVHALQPWEDYDFCICDPEQTWCVAVTHNGDVKVVGREQMRRA